MKKIICTVTNDLIYDQRMHRICNTLQDEGIEVVLVGRKRKLSKKLQHKNFKQKRLNCLFEKGKIFYIEYNIRLFFYLLVNRFDVVHSVDLDSILSGYIISKIKGKKLVFDSHEIFTELPELEDRQFVKSIWLWIEKILVSKSKFNITVNESLVEYYREKYGAVFTSIINVSNKQLRTPSDSSIERFVLYQGAVNKGRGLDELIRSLTDIDLKLKIAGEGDEFNKLQSLVEELNLESKVDFLGYVTPDKLIELTNKAYFGINLLDKNSGNYFYSLANKFFDYVHGGIPQISMNFPEYVRINDEFEVALLIEDLSETSIKNGICRLLENEVFYEKLKRNTSVCSDKYNWQHESKKLLRFYQNVISSIK